MKTPSLSEHSFNRAPTVRVPRSVFDRSHFHKTTFNGGYLVPILLDEVLPGDTFNVQAQVFARLTTPLKPVMDNLYLDTFYFFVPNRLLWTHWVNFMGEQTNPGDSISFSCPTVQIPIGGPVVNTLFDYFGIPTTADITQAFNICNFWGRGYNKIYHDWFRDENQQNAPQLDTGDGPDTYANYVLKRRGKRFDYFTSCLPWPQKGSTAVSFPIGTSAPVIPTGDRQFKWEGSITGGGRNINGLVAGQSLAYSGAPYGATNIMQWTSTGTDTKLVADLTNASAATINQLRLAEWTQVLLERDARYGSRYTETVRSHFGVISPDARLQRSEYLGGGSVVINQHPVPMTAMSSGGTAAGQQGNLAAFATAGGHGGGFAKSFTEHGVIIGLACVRAELSYQQGVHKMFLRSTRYDFYVPAFATIGEQAVLQNEIFVTGVPATDATVFGYQERFGEMRYKPSQISGQYRSTAGTPLDVWHLAQKFTGAPILGDTFISETPPISRVVAVTTEPQFFFDGFFKMKVARAMPVYGIPSLGGRF